MLCPSDFVDDVMFSLNGAESKTEFSRSHQSSVTLRVMLKSAILIALFIVAYCTLRGAGVPPFRLCSSLVHSLFHLLLFITFSPFPFLIHFTYFLLLSI